MNAATKIKVYLKEQIQKGKINKNDILKLEPAHLMKTKPLQDIDKSTIATTLQEIKIKLNPDLLNEDIDRIVNHEDNPLSDQISAIMKGLE